MHGLPNKEIGCHHTGFEKKCFDLVTSGACTRWIQIMGRNPNTGGEINKYDCIDNWIPMLLIENSFINKQTGAAVESFRNEMVKANEATLNLVAGEQRKLLNGV